MCGFIGIVDVSGRGPDAVQRKLLLGLDQLRRRGPDSQQLWAAKGLPVHLGFARLAIVDTDKSANQPLFSSHCGLGLVFNGEIYNYLELRTRLKNDFQFKTRSDTEVILAAYAVWGLAGFTELRGMFSGAIVDTGKQRVFLFRDPVGKKPLFRYEISGEVIFGSSVLALVAASSHEAKLNSAAIDDYWRQGWVNPERSLIMGCSPVMPGEILEYNFGGVFICRHSCRPELTMRDGDSDELIEYCGLLLEQSIRRRLINNPSPISLLSGGIDSTLVTQLMHSQVGGKALTLSSRLRLSPDEPYAEFAAERIGVPLQKVRFSSRRLADSIAWSMDLQDEPLAMISFFMLANLIAAAKEWGRILLTGDGGDEVFLGYGRPSDWIEATPRGEHNPSSWSVGVDEPDWMSKWGRYVVRDQLLGHMFTKVDRAASEQGVETRSPLLDWDLIALARSLTPGQLLQGGQMKAVLKRQLEGWPERFIERRKVGFTYHLRWHWALANFSGLREGVQIDSCERFSDGLPDALRIDPKEWTMLAIFRNFTTAWKLFAWSSFMNRLKDVTHSNRVCSAVAHD